MVVHHYPLVPILRMFEERNGAYLLHEAYSKPMSKNENHDRNVLRLLSIVIFGVESNSGVKLPLK